MTTAGSRAPLPEGDIDVALFAAIPDPVRASPSGAVDPEGKAAAREVGPTRGEVRRRRALTMGAVVVWAFAVVAFLGIRQHLSMVTSVCQIGIPTALGLGALAVALSGGRLGLGPSLVRTVVFAIVPVVAFVGLGLAFGVPTDATPHHDAFQCGAVEVIASVVSLGIFAVALRRSNVTNERWRGALFGSAIGVAWAGLWGLHCADESTRHIVLGHGYPVVVCAVLGAFLLSRVARVR